MEGQAYMESDVTCYPNDLRRKRNFAYLYLKNGYLPGACTGLFEKNQKTFSEDIDLFLSATSALLLIRVITSRLDLKLLHLN